MDRYGRDVLSAGWREKGKLTSTAVTLKKGLLLEDAKSGFCGEVQRWENKLVVLEGRGGRLRSFPMGPGFLDANGKPVTVKAPIRAAPAALRQTASGSRRAERPEKAKVALPSRIYVEGRHDAELVEKVWGDDLRHVGVVVEYLGGIDDLPGIVDEFAPGKGRRLGVLVDHLVPRTKESRIAAEVMNGSHGEYVLVTGHPFIDIWEAIRPEKIGRSAWPRVPMGEDWKKGVCARMGWPRAEQADIARVWRALLGKVQTWTDLDTRLLTEMERLIDFVTQDHEV